MLVSSHIVHVPISSHILERFDVIARSMVRARTPLLVVVLVRLAA